MVRAASPVGRPAQGENDDAHGPAGCAEERVVSIHHPIGVADQVLRVLQSWVAKRRVNVHAHPPVRTGAHEQAVPRITRPRRRQRTIAPHGSRLFPNSTCFNRSSFEAVIHSKASILKDR